MLRVTQESFDALIAENVEEFGMSADEALAEAVASLRLQGVDLGSLRTTLPETGGRRTLRAVERVRFLRASLDTQPRDTAAVTAALVSLASELLGGDIEPGALEAAGLLLRSF